MPAASRQCKNGFPGPSCLCEAPFGKFSRAVPARPENFFHRAGSGLPSITVQESASHSEKIAESTPLAVKLFEKIAGRDGHLAKRFFGMLRFPGIKFLARSEKSCAYRE